jgi:hypothetical protein
MSLPFPEGTAALPTDSEQRSLQKLVELANNGGGGGGGSGPDVKFGAFTDPNGNVTGSVDDIYKSVEADGGDGSVWLKQSGAGTDTGWI